MQYSGTYTYPIFTNLDELDCDERKIVLNMPKNGKVDIK